VSSASSAWSCPHVLRLIVGPDHRILLPASALAGATFLVAADTLARSGTRGGAGGHRHRGGGCALLPLPAAAQGGAHGVIRVDDVHVAFGDVEVLDGVDLAVEAGEFVGLVGPNSAGKTTLLRTVNGALAPDAGEVFVGDDRIHDLSSRATSRRVATVPQDTSVRFAFDVADVVAMGRTPHRSRFSSDPDQTAHVDAALERTETAHLRDRRVDTLSGGERQRVFIARALAQDAPSLVLDEPTASLDVNHATQTLALVRELADEDRAVLAAIHDLESAARFCDRLALVHDGRIVDQGSRRTC